MDFYANLRINKEGALSLLSTMCSKGTVRLPDSAWEAILKDMVIVCDQLMSPTVSEIDCVRVFFGKLLKAKSETPLPLKGRKISPGAPPLHRIRPRKDVPFPRALC